MASQFDDTACDWYIRMICLDLGASRASARRRWGREEQQVMAEESGTDWRSLEQFSFGDSPALAD